MRKFIEHFQEIAWTGLFSFRPIETEIFEVKSGDNFFSIKDENRQPNGSFKDRGLTYQLAKHLTAGKNKFAISSSGNAAVSAAKILAGTGAQLEIFVSSKMNTAKLEKLKLLTESTENIKLNLSPRPRSDLLKFINLNPDYVNLRGSTDIEAIPGYKTIAYELSEEVPLIDAILIPCSSGTSTVGIWQGFSETNKNVQIHVCQTTKVNAIARGIVAGFEPAGTSLADAITDKVAHRKSQVRELVKASGGSAWVITDEELLTARQEISDLTGKLYSYNSLLAYAGYKQAVATGRVFNQPVLLFSGL